MNIKDYDKITAADLLEKIRQEKPDNRNRDEGYALVNVLSADHFDDEHIVSSINIPKGKEAEFEQRFSKDKEIVLYCASNTCDASPKVAEELASRGFSRVRDFEAGMAGWKRIDGPVEGAAV